MTAIVIRIKGRCVVGIGLRCYAATCKVTSIIKIVHLCHSILSYLHIRVSVGSSPDVCNPFRNLKFRSDRHAHRSRRRQLHLCFQRHPECWWGVHAHARVRRVMHSCRRRTTDADHRQFHLHNRDCMRAKSFN